MVAFGCVSAVTSSWKPAPERGPLRSVMSERSEAIATSVTTSLSSFTGATATRFDSQPDSCGMCTSVPADSSATRRILPQSCAGGMASANTASMPNGVATSAWPE